MHLRYLVCSVSASESLFSSAYNICQIMRTLLVFECHGEEAPNGASRKRGGFVPLSPVYMAEHQY